VRSSTIFGSANKRKHHKKYPVFREFSRDLSALLKSSHEIIGLFREGIVFLSKCHEIHLFSVVLLLFDENFADSDWNMVEGVLNSTEVILSIRLCIL
jgi:hypothetical protein